MMFKTHIVFGFLMGLLFLDVFNVSNKILFMTVAVIAAAIPDIDHPDSAVGKKVKIIGFLFKHRGFFHSILAAGIFSLGINYIFRNYAITIAFVIGYVSHILIDMLTHAGVMPLHPLSNFKIKGFMKSNGIIEWLIFLGLVVLSGLKLISM